MQPHLQRRGRNVATSFDWMRMKEMACGGSGFWLRGRRLSKVQILELTVFQFDRMTDELITELRIRELALQRGSVRRSQDSLLELLHPDFFEVGRSGRTYTREETVQNLLCESPEIEIRSKNFRVALLGPDAAMLTYESVHVGQSGEEFHPAHRVSVWIRSATGWQMRYHQGTPALPPSARSA